MIAIDDAIVPFAAGFDHFNARVAKAAPASFSRNCAVAIWITRSGIRTTVSSMNRIAGAQARYSPRTASSSRIYGVVVVNPHCFCSISICLVMRMAFCA